MLLGVGEPVAEAPNYGWFLLETMVVLAVVCVLAWLTLRFWVRRAYGPGRTRGPIRVLARTALEPRRTLYVVEVGGKCLLIGAGEGPLALLGEVDGAKVRAALVEESAGKRSFLTVLRGGAKAPEPVVPREVEPPRDQAPRDDAPKPAADPAAETKS